MDPSLFERTGAVQKRALSTPVVGKTLLCLLVYQQRRKSKARNMEDSSGSKQNLSLGRIDYLVFIFLGTT